MSDLVLSLASDGLARPSFIHKAISEHLFSLGYPAKSIKSMLRCGSVLGLGFKHCECSTEKHFFRYCCNLRTCSFCSKKRTRRIFRDYLPLFRKYPVKRNTFFQFLTISPPNFKDFKSGLADIKRNVKKFFRRKYISDRIKGGFYVLETTQNKDTGYYNIHVHMVLYGNWIDYRIRGRCMACNQSLLKYDKISKKYYCANRHCNSLNVVRFGETKVNKEWRLSAGSSCMVYGERVRSYVGAIHYLTKYVSDDKTEFNSLKDKAQYIFDIRKQKLIIPFGCFYHVKVKKHKFICQFCNSFINFDFDFSYYVHYIDKLKPSGSCSESQKPLTCWGSRSEQLPLLSNK